MTVRKRGKSRVKHTLHGANDVHNRRGIVQRRQADEDIHLPHGNQLPE